MIRDFCKGLCEAEIARLEETERQLPLLAELTGSDIFIDCFLPEGEAVVAAEARTSEHTLYETSVLGQRAPEAQEPAVYRAQRTLCAVRDIKAVTQEGRTVRQDVVPLRGEEGRCIGVLIREKDISESLLQEKKYEALARTYESRDSSLRSSEPDGATLLLREMHHRVKNNLQLIASILNLQARRCEGAETRRILQENVGRVLSIAALHDILARDTQGLSHISGAELLGMLQSHLQMLVPEGKHLRIRVEADEAALSADAAASAALVINELVTNAIEHAFPAREEGEIVITLCAGGLSDTVTVSDNGVGFDPAAVGTGSLGLKIVRATVHDKLQGRLHIRSDEHGSSISFSMKR